MYGMFKSRVTAVKFRFLSRQQRAIYVCTRRHIDFRRQIKQANSARDEF